MINENDVKQVTSIFDTPNQSYFTHLWIAEITNYFQGRILVSVVKTATRQVRGLLLAPPLYTPLDREFGGSDPKKYIDLDNWIDPVRLALQSINLMSESDGWDSQDGSLQYFIDMRIYTAKLMARLNYGPGVIKNPDMSTLWEGVLSACQVLAPRYNDKEINECLTRPEYDDE